MSKLPGFKYRVPSKEQLKPNSRAESLHPGTPLANVVQGFISVGPLNDSISAGASASFKARAGTAKGRLDSRPALQPGINTAIRGDITDIAKGGRKAR